MYPAFSLSQPTHNHCHAQAGSLASKKKAHEHSNDVFMRSTWDFQEYYQAYCTGNLSILPCSAQHPADLCLQCGRSWSGFSAVVWALSVSSLESKAEQFNITQQAVTALKVRPACCPPRRLRLGSLSPVPKFFQQPQPVIFLPLKNKRKSEKRRVALIQ